MKFSVPECVKEALDKAFPQGWVLFYGTAQNDLRIHKHNPKHYKAIEQIYDILPDIDAEDDPKGDEEDGE
jgi:hypothetical protein